MPDEPIELERIRRAAGPGHLGKRRGKENAFPHTMAASRWPGAAARITICKA